MQFEVLPLALLSRNPFIDSHLSPTCLPVLVYVCVWLQVGALPAVGFVNGLALGKSGTLAVAALGQVGAPGCGLLNTAVFVDLESWVLNHVSAVFAV